MNESVHAHMLLDRVRELNRQLMYSTAAAPLAWLTVAYLMADVIPAFNVFLWLGMMMLAESSSFAATLQFKRANPPASQALRWARIHGTLAAGSGLAWGMSAWLLWPSGNLEYQELLLLALCGVTAVGVISNAAMRRASLGLVVPVWGIAIAQLLAEGDRIHWALAALALVFAVMMVVVGFQVTQTLSNSIVLRYENLGLLDELRAAKLVAEKANEAKSSFLAAATHDLRQPVQAIGLSLRTLAHLAAEPAAARTDLLQSIDQTRQALSGLNALLAALLDISQLDAGHVPPALQSVCVAWLFAELNRDFAAAAAAKDLPLTFTVSARAKSAQVLSEPVALRRLMGNLLDNAIRHTAKGRVLVTSRLQSGAIALEVWDTGCGIAPDELDNIFTEFHQLDRPASAQHNALSTSDGFGLGLAIVRRIAKVLGHQVQVRSKVGSGSVFSVRLARTWPDGSHC
jgi:two-component system, sensor histidine kinase